jgi:MraZ protein
MSKLERQAKPGGNAGDADGPGAGGGAAGAGGTGGGEATPAGNRRFLYKGEFEHGLDEKRRLQIPARWRVPNGELTLILWPRKEVKEACLMVLPVGQTDALVDRISDETAFADEDGDVLRRLIARRSETVKFDSAGRICVPDRLVKAVGIEKQAMLVGMLERGFQIWNVERYQQVTAEDEVMLQQAFKILAKRK